jgi:hypothetical protein
MHESMEETHLQRSKFISKKLDSLVEDLSKTNETYSFDFLELIKFLRKHIHNLAENYKES